MRKFMSSEEWDRHIAAQAVSGKTVRNYCSANALDLSSFYRQRRKRNNRNSAAESRTFVLAGAYQSSKVSGSSLCIRVKDITLTLDRGYCSDDLETVLVTVAKVRDVLCPE